MKKLIVCLILLFALPAMLSAQWRIKTGINQGYEWNIFKNPERIVENSDTLRRNRLWRNSSFNELTADVDYAKEMENSMVRIKSDLSTHLYHQATEAHEFSYSLEGSYRSNFSSSKYIELSPEYSVKRQDGVEPVDQVFSSRLSYRDMRIPLELDFYLGNLAWLRFETMYRNKMYDRRNDKQTGYNAYFLETLYKKSFDDSGRFDHEIEVFNQTQYRDQVTTDFEEPNVQEKNFRQFTKIETSIIYRLQSRQDLFEIELPVSGTLFYDHPSGNLDYHEVEFGTQLDVNIGRAEISAGVDRTLRNFKNFNVGSSGNTLFYGYWTGDAEIELALGRQVYLKVKARYITRSSTRKKLTSAFYREYTTSYVQSGIRINIQ
ncbi:hypothetical protein [Rhodohalobacter sp. 8-1]|uniref:hypothetical protein n=1 Tax=Rhodohalobacter sp. 8-1 TaxID=3131972 RepID=UPI0030EB2468